MDDPKRQKIPTGLWVIGTPIGNLGDFAPRARHALEQADVILCEDTRRTRILLEVLEIKKPLKRIDAHSKPAALENVLQDLASGRAIALVTDAGMPGVSDPGQRLVAAAHVRGVTVLSFPGPSALTALVSVAGLGDGGFFFRGFYPRKKKEREQELARLKAGETCVWFESPQRVGQTLREMSETVGSMRAAVAKELTKVNERTWVGTLREVSTSVGAHLSEVGPRGEWCLMVEGMGEKLTAPTGDWQRALECLLGVKGVSIPAAAAAARVSQIFGVDRKKVYQRAIEIKNGQLTKRSPTT